MTIEEAIRVLIAIERYPSGIKGKDEACEMAISALYAQQQREQLWHDAKTDPPPQPGLYYGAKDDTNSMWAVQYRDGEWTLDWYPKTKMNIVRWAFYDAFSGDDDQQEAERNEPLTLDEMSKMEGQPVWWKNLVFPDRPAQCKVIWHYGYHTQHISWTDGKFDLFGSYGKTWLAYRRPPKSK